MTEQTKTTKAVLLAGGIASGFGGTEEKPDPKSLRKLDGISLLERNVRFLVDEVIIQMVLLLQSEKACKEILKRKLKD